MDQIVGPTGVPGARVHQHQGQSVTEVCRPAVEIWAPVDEALHLFPYSQLLQLSRFFQCSRWDSTEGDSTLKGWRSQALALLSLPSWRTHEPRGSLSAFCCASLGEVWRVQNECSSYPFIASFLLSVFHWGAVTSHLDSRALMKVISLMDGC